MPLKFPFGRVDTTQQKTMRADALLVATSRDGRITVAQVARDAVCVEAPKLGTIEQRRIAAVLERLQWERKPSGGTRW